MEDTLALQDNAITRLHKLLDTETDEQIRRRGSFDFIIDLLLEINPAAFFYFIFGCLQFIACGGASILWFLFGWTVCGVYKIIMWITYYLGLQSLLNFITGSN